MFCSIIIIVHNVPSRTEILQVTHDCLKSLKETVKAEACELILIDNGSQDNGLTLNLLKEESSGYKTKILRSEKNLNISKWWNDAIEIAEGDTIVLVNNDVTFNKRGWLEALTAPLSEAHIGMSGSRMMGWRGLEFLEGAFLAFKKGIIHEYAEKGKIFDEQFVFTGEDVDLCERVRRGGRALIATNIEDSGFVSHKLHESLSWANHDVEAGKIGGGENILNIMHEGRLQLCRKYGMPEDYND